MKKLIVRASMLAVALFILFVGLFFVVPGGDVYAYGDAVNKRHHRRHHSTRRTGNSNRHHKMKHKTKTGNRPY